MKSLFTVVIPVFNQHDATERFIETWFQTAKSKIEILFIDNGSEKPLLDQKFFKNWRRSPGVNVIRNDANTGVYPTFQQAYLQTDTQFIFYSHNDVEMLEYGWDEKLSKLLRRMPEVGVCGMFGAKAIGTPNIYKAPYDFRQMQRWLCITVPSMVGGGAREIQSDYERVIVLDGFSLIVNTDMVEKLGGFDHNRYPPHHMYDQDICVSSHYAGFLNYVIDIDCKHHGGVTSTREKWAEAMDTTDLKIHREAHRVFYEKWKNKLPVIVK